MHRSQDVCSFLDRLGDNKHRESEGHDKIMSSIRIFLSVLIVLLLKNCLDKILFS